MYYDSIAKAVILPDAVGKEAKFEQDVHRKQSLEHARAGSKLYKGGKFSEAALSFTRAIQEYPDDPAYYGSRALCYIDLGNYESAITDCSIALKYDPSNVKFQFRLGLAQFGAGRVGDAIETLVGTYSFSPCENDLKAVGEKLDMFVAALNERDKAAYRKFIHDARKEVDEGWCSTKKDSSSNMRDKTDPFMDPSNPLQAQTIAISNFCGAMATERELKRLIKPFGRMIGFSIGNKCALVTFVSPENAVKALNALQGFDFHGQILTLRFKLEINDAYGNSSENTLANKNVDRATKSLASLTMTNPKAELCGSAKPAVPLQQLQQTITLSDAPFRTVCLEPLPNGCNEDDLWVLAAQHGQIARISIARDRRIGFIEYNNVKVALHASKQPFKIYGRDVKARLQDDGINPPIPSASSSVFSSGVGKLENVYTPPCLNEPNKVSQLNPLIPKERKPSVSESFDLKTLWIGNLDPEMDQESVYSMFKRFSPKSAVVFRSSFCGLVCFHNETDAANALRELRGAKVKNNIMKVEYKKNR